MELDNIRKLVLLLEKGAAGINIYEMPYEQILLVGPTEDKLLINAWHTLQHFILDIDIRSGDSEYDQYQREQLSQYANQLRQRYYIEK